MLLFVSARVTATAVAVGLLLAHRVTTQDPLLALFVVTYAALTVGAALRLRPARHWLALLWAADSGVILGLMLAAGDWRSPFYLLALTTLILPATTLTTGRAVAFTVVFMCAYFGVAVSTGVDWSTLQSTARLESFATHMLLPVLLGVGLAYSAELLRRLKSERRKSEQLVLEQERRRLARELHDSAKQRMHAAHLVLSSSPPDAGPAGEAIQLALRELEAAASEMQASLTDLRSPGWPADLLGALRGRAARLEAAAGIPVRVSGEEPRLASPVAVHVFYVLSEAMINAVRHAGATSVRTRLQADGERLTAVVEDDGHGLPEGAAWDSQGIRSMVERTQLLGGRLRLESRPEGSGTRVSLEVPLTSAEHSVAA